MGRTFRSTVLISPEVPGSLDRFKAALRRRSKDLEPFFFASFISHRHIELKGQVKCSRLDALPDIGACPYVFWETPDLLVLPVKVDSGQIQHEAVLL